MSGFVDINGVTVHTSVYGPEGATPLVFSNSLGTDFRVWSPLLSRLPKGPRIVLYDKRGHGLSDCPTSNWAMDEHVADLAAILDHHHLKGAIICGLSVGGLIAQLLATRRPDLVRALILCDTAAKIGDDAMWEARIAAIREDGIAAVADAILERWFTSDFRTNRRSELALWRNMLVRTPVAGYVHTCAAIQDTDATESTAKLTVPTLVVVGEEDGSTPPDLVRRTADLIPGARFEVIAGAGHIPCVEQPGILADLINGFIKDHDLV